WSLAEAAGGSVDANGLYTAPRGPGTFHVIATSIADPARSATAAIKVIVPPVSVTLTPVAITVRPGASLHFTAVAAGATDTRLQHFGRRVPGPRRSRRYVSRHRYRSGPDRDGGGHGTPCRPRRWRRSGSGTHANVRHLLGRSGCLGRGRPPHAGGRPARARWQ